MCACRIRTHALRCTALRCAWCTTAHAHTPVKCLPACVHTRSYINPVEYGTIVKSLVGDMPDEEVRVGLRRGGRLGVWQSRGADGASGLATSLVWRARACTPWLLLTRALCWSRASVARTRPQLKTVPRIGNSPTFVSVSDFRTLAPAWMNMTLRIWEDKEAHKVCGGGGGGTATGL